MCFLRTLLRTSVSTWAPVDRSTSYAERAGASACDRSSLHAVRNPRSFRCYQGENPRENGDQCGNLLGGVQTWAICARNASSSCCATTRASMVGSPRDGGTWMHGRMLASTSTLIAFQWLWCWEDIKAVDRKEREIRYLIVKVEPAISQTVANITEKLKQENIRGKS